MSFIHVGILWIDRYLSVGNVTDKYKIIKRFNYCLYVLLNFLSLYFILKVKENQKISRLSQGQLNFLFVYK